MILTPRGFQEEGRRDGDVSVWKGHYETEKNVPWANFGSDGTSTGV